MRNLKLTDDIDKLPIGLVETHEVVSPEVVLVIVVVVNHGLGDRDIASHLIRVTSARTHKTILAILEFTFFLGMQLSATDYFECIGPLQMENFLQLLVPHHINLRIKRVIVNEVNLTNSCFGTSKTARLVQILFLLRVGFSCRSVWFVLFVLYTGHAKRLLKELLLPILLLLLLLLFLILNLVCCILFVV